MKKNMVYGLIGISVKNGNYNASFDKSPKQNSLGEIYASPQSLGFAIKHQLEKDGYKILYKRSVGEEGVRNLKESFESKTGQELKNKITENEVKSILFKEFMDIRQFGCTFALSPNFGIMGANQIGFGHNKYAETEEIISELLAPFSADNNKKKEKSNEDDEKLKNNTLGEQVLVDEAHYFHSIVINPYEYEQYVGVIDGFEGYTQEDYKAFKDASMIAVSNYNSKSKTGCQNSFALYIETKDDIKNKINLNALDRYVKVYKEEKIIYDIGDLSAIVNDLKESIKSVELYYNPYIVELKHNIEDVKLFNIITKKEL
ncbi:type I CRISPR-associated protein Cas7 [Clostridium mediterraneense]|uniref:type I CRISPR-associated protein Cas7 n=1 Tax=Clostridium mediterraneense TaxID=1805472 RepID=UPI00082E877D|nr:type I CRISPR-associated protein Cas7 [Clostridium mediterraneense]